MAALRETFAAVVMNHGSVLTGLAISYPSCLIPQLYKEGFYQNTYVASMLGSICTLVFGFSTFASILYVGKTSRKKLTRISLVIHCIGTVVVICATDIFSLCVGLVIQCSVLSNFVPVIISYISEVCQTEHRGTFLSSVFVCLTLGLSLNYILNSLVIWRTMAIIVLCITISGFIGTFFIPESNFWYLLQGDKEAARSSIKWFLPGITEEELDMRVVNILETSEADTTEGSHFLDFLKSLTEAKFLKPFLIATLINLFRSGNGRLVLGVYIQTLFTNMSTPYDISHLVGCFGWADLVGSIFVLFVMHKIKRKTLVYVSTLIMVLCLLVIVIYLFIHSYVKLPPWLPVVALCVYAMCIMTAYNSVITIIASEIQHPTYRPQINMFQNGFLFLIYSFYTFVFPHVVKIIPMQYILIYFILSIMACSLSVTFLVPETSRLEFYENEERSSSDSISEIVA